MRAPLADPHSPMPVFVKVTVAGPQEAPAPMPTRPQLWEGRVALDMCEAGHVAAGVEYVEALMRHAQGLLRAGITQRRLVKSFARARFVLLTLCNGQVHVTTAELVRAWEMPSYLPDDPFEPMCVMVPLLVHLICLPRDNAASVRLGRVCRHATTWCDDVTPFDTVEDARQAYRAGIQDAEWIREMANDAAFGLVLLRIACTFAIRCDCPQCPCGRPGPLGVDGNGRVTGLKNDVSDVVHYAMSRGLNGMPALFGTEKPLWQRVYFFIEYARACLPPQLDAEHDIRIRAIFEHLGRAMASPATMPSVPPKSTFESVGRVAALIYEE